MPCDLRASKQLHSVACHAGTVTPQGGSSGEGRGRARRRQAGVSPRRPLRAEESDRKPEVRLAGCGIWGLRGNLSFIWKPMENSPETSNVNVT